MNSGKRLVALANLMNTSVDDCRTTLEHYTDPELLCDVLLESHARGHLSREQAVRRRIGKLILAGIKP